MTLGWISNALSPYRMLATLSRDDSPRGAEVVTEDGRALPLKAASLRIEAGGGLSTTARAVLARLRV